VVVAFDVTAYRHSEKNVSARGRTGDLSRKLSVRRKS